MTNENEENEENDANSKHKIKGKHALKHDSIFKGRKNQEDEEIEELENPQIPKEENFNYDSKSTYFDENKKPEDYARTKELQKEIYDVVINDLQLTLRGPRRKPGRDQFNRYMAILSEKIDMSKYSYSELFTEFAQYFSDNIKNMFKLLNQYWGGIIAQELNEKTNNKMDDMDFM